MHHKIGNDGPLATFSAVYLHIPIAKIQFI